MVLYCTVTTLMQQKYPEPEKNCFSEFEAHKFVGALLGQTVWSVLNLALIAPVTRY